MIISNRVVRANAADEETLLEQGKFLTVLLFIINFFLNFKGVRIDSIICQNIGFNSRNDAEF
jgi:hypothetical protein